MSGLPPRPKPSGHVAGCDNCDRRKGVSIACYLHRTPAEEAWFARIEEISNAPRVAVRQPTLF